MTEWAYPPAAPPAPGWYAIRFCWEVDEGVHVGADYWDGSKWRARLPVVSWSSHPFPTAQQTALEWARKNDPELLTSSPPRAK